MNAHWELLQLLLLLLSAPPPPLLLQLVMQRQLQLLYLPLYAWRAGTAQLLSLTRQGVHLSQGLVRVGLPAAAWVAAALPAVQLLLLLLMVGLRLVAALVQPWLLGLLQQWVLQAVALLLLPLLPLAGVLAAAGDAVLLPLLLH